MYTDYFIQVLKSFNTSQAEAAYSCRHVNGRRAMTQQKTRGIIITERQWRILPCVQICRQFLKDVILFHSWISPVGSSIMSMQSQLTHHQNRKFQSLEDL
jgi:hypothetical protein